MGASWSTIVGSVVGWAVVLSAGAYFSRDFIPFLRGRREPSRVAHRIRHDDRQHHHQSRKENKEKAKQQRGEAYSKDADAQVKLMTQVREDKTPATLIKQEYSSDDNDADQDNKTFARQLMNAKQGLNLNGPKKPEIKKQKSVKLSRANVLGKSQTPSDSVVSAPSSTAGVDADDDASSVASPESKADDASGVADMLEPKTAGPSVIRLIDTDQAKPKEKKKAKAHEAETKKQRQNRKKAEAAKAARDEAEVVRQKQLEAQRRQARIAEGRAAKDGSSMSAAPAKSAWNMNGVRNANGTSGSDTKSSVTVQPLDTFESATKSASATTHTTGTSASSAPETSDSWINSDYTEEEQLKMLRDDQPWSEVKTKKLGKLRSKPAAETAAQPKSAVTQPLQVSPVTSAPVVTKTFKASTNGKPASKFSSNSAFAALSSGDEPDIDHEWDV